MAESRGNETEDGVRSSYQNKRNKKEFMQGCCGVLQNLIGKMLCGVTWQMIVILLVLIEVVINIILLLILFHAIKDSKDHFASNILHFIAISILCIFVLEIFLKLFALGWRFFWREKWELFDAIVVMVAIFLEILLRVLHAQNWEGLGLVVVLRLWRVLRLVTVMVIFKEEFYELIEDEIDGKRKKQDQTPATEPSETESLQTKDEK